MVEYIADLANGKDVWCTWAQKPARTADGFCQWCGSTKHDAIEDYILRAFRREEGNDE